MCGIAINIGSFVHLLNRVDFDAIVDHLALAHITKSKVELDTTRLKRLLGILSSYLFHLYYTKGKGMILSDFLYTQKHDDSNAHEIIPISFNMQGILQSRYYKLGKGNLGKYLVQMRSQAKSSSIKLSEGHGIGKGLDPNILPEKQVMKPIVITKVR